MFVSLSLSCLITQAWVERWLYPFQVVLHKQATATMTEPSSFKKMRNGVRWEEATFQFFKYCNAVYWDHRLVSSRANFRCLFGGQKHSGCERLGRKKVCVKERTAWLFCLAAAEPSLCRGWRMAADFRLLQQGILIRLICGCNLWRYLLHGSAVDVATVRDHWGKWGGGSNLQKFINPQISYKFTWFW